MIAFYFVLILCQQPDGFQSTWDEMQDFLKQEGYERDIQGVVQFFVGRPYLVGSLETEGPEVLKYHLDGFDCFTLTESAIAFSLLKEPDQKAYERLLRQTRYRDGVLDGYQSRLHYATEWSDQAVRLGLLEDVTAGFSGSQAWSKAIDFMTKHRKAYPKLADDKVFDDISSFEHQLSLRQRTYLPVAELDPNLSNFYPGDIIMILTKKEGLDVGHFCYVVGESTSEQPGLPMVHASSTQKEIVYVEDMFRYIRNYPHVLGVMVLRLKKA